MNHVIRSILLFCTVHMMTLFHAEVIHREAMLLVKLRNLPHRALGMLFYCHMKQPWRPDYLRDYLVEYTNYSEREFILEGQTRPVVPMYAVSMAVQFPKNKEIQLIKKVIVHNALERNRLAREELTPTVEVDSETTKEVK